MHVPNSRTSYTGRFAVILKKGLHFNSAAEGSILSKKHASWRAAVSEIYRTV